MATVLPLSPSDLREIAYNEAKVSEQITWITNKMKQAAADGFMYVEISTKDTTYAQVMYDATENYFRELGFKVKLESYGSVTTYFEHYYKISWQHG